MVSIPGGFFRGLQHYVKDPAGFYAAVSIPGGFFRGLQRQVGLDVDSSEDMFQSLAGFFVACNIIVSALVPDWRDSFNPWRVFSWLATKGRRKKSDDPTKFQSLAGFFVACNHLPDGDVVCITRWFQSLAGFFVACNKADNRINDFSRPVSIPGGFFRGLQRHP